MKTSRFGFSITMAILMAAPALAQMSEQPAGGTPPAAPAGAEAQTPQPMPGTPPSYPSDVEKDKKKADGKTERPQPQPQ